MLFYGFEQNEEEVIGYCELCGEPIHCNEVNENSVDNYHDECYLNTDMYHYETDTYDTIVKERLWDCK